jgi:hypothetical protein
MVTADVLVRAEAALRTADVLVRAEAAW